MQTSLPAAPSPEAGLMDGQETGQTIGKSGNPVNREKGCLMRNNQLKFIAFSQTAPEAEGSGTQLLQNWHK
jgi:hypothetical protein